MKAKKKKLDFTVKPRTAKEALPADPDGWVHGESGPSAPRKQKDPAVPQKRLTLNLPAEMHKAFKGQCVRLGVTIQDRVQSLIERDLAADQPAAGLGNQLL
jgi:hypothetical protein